MGEVFNGSIDYVGGYSYFVTAVFNYPFFFTIRNVWQGGQSMYNIRSTLDAMKPKFKDLDALGIFVDNHDNARFLNGNHNTNRFKNALAFSLTFTGIPFVYYGDEQGYAGGNDPYCRETLWNDMNENSDLYKFIKTTVTARKAHKIWNQPHVERYVDDNFYAFTRGDVFIATTNTDNTI